MQSVTKDQKVGCLMLVQVLHDELEERSRDVSWCNSGSRHQRITTIEFKKQTQDFFDGRMEQSVMKDEDMKSGACADGGKQRDHISKEDSTSWMVSTMTVPLKGVMEAKEDS